MADALFECYYTDRDGKDTKHILITTENVDEYSNEELITAFITFMTLYSSTFDPSWYDIESALGLREWTPNPNAWEKVDQRLKALYEHILKRMAA